MSVKKEITEIDLMQMRTSINIHHNGDLMQFILDEQMQMRCSIAPESIPSFLHMKALIDDAAKEMSDGYEEFLEVIKAAKNG